MAFIGGLLAGSFASILLGNAPVSNAVDQALYNLLPNNPLEAIILVDLFRRNEIDSVAYETQMKLLGYDQTRANQIIIASQQLITANEALQNRRQQGQDAVLRFANGDINQSQFDTEIAGFDSEYIANTGAIGFSTNEATKFRAANREIPSFQAFLEFMAKEVFEPDQRAKFTLDNELPDLFVKFAAQFDLGLEDAKNYWAAHWNHVSPEQVFRMFHRYRDTRTNVNTEELDVLGLTHNDVEISSTDVDDYLKLIELPEYWRNRLKAISYDPLGKIDLRWAYEEGIITLTELRSRLEDTGLSPNNALLLSKVWARRFTAGRKKNLQDNTLELRKLQAISRSQAITDLQSQGLDLEDATFKIDQVDQKIEEDLIQAKLNALSRKFNRDHVEESDLITEIELITGNTERTPLILEMLLDNKEKSAQRLTSRQLVTARKKGVIDDLQLTNKLQDLNYSAEDITILVDLAQPSPV